MSIPKLVFWAFTARELPSNLSSKRSTEISSKWTLT